MSVDPKQCALQLGQELLATPAGKMLRERIDFSSYSRVAGLHGSSASLLLSALHETEAGIILALTAGADEAGYLFSDLSGLLDSDQLLYFPSSYREIFAADQRSQEGLVQRMELIEQQESIKSGKRRKCIIISYLDAIAETFPSQQHIEEHSISLQVGQEIELENVIESLEALHFTRQTYAGEPGCFASRGSIIDVFSYTDNQPYRIDFLGDKIDSIRKFEVETQLSTERVNSLKIVPDTPHDTEDTPPSLFEILPTGTLWWLDNVSDSLESYEQRFNTADSSEQVRLISPERLADLLADSHHRIVEVGEKTLKREEANISFQTQDQPIFSKNFNLLARTISEKFESGYRTYIFAEQQSQSLRLKDVLEKLDVDPQAFTLVQLPLKAGFVEPNLMINVYTDHQIFDRYHRFRLKRRLSRRVSLTEQDMQALHPGDYVVHIDHGVGVFEGLVRKEENGVPQEFVRLSYRDKDSLLVNIHNLDRLSKYQGKDGTPPVLHKLGAAAWGKLKQKAKGQLQEMARELIQLYAERRKTKGFAFSSDSHMQEELEASFAYQDTPDQLQTTQEVKRDMESSIPMDRLICGDVGYGKTEIAIRAAFKAIYDGKQVAVLVPTTLLAIQHHETFSRRLADFPCRVEVASRLQTAKQKREIYERLAEGKIDIIIGTHTLLRESVKFKDLGLLVVDEEQKFGVAAKERLKRLRVNVDTLTLTATPIPRTLQFSLMGARDLSRISTPPPNRYPIYTRVQRFSEELIHDAIMQEMQRGGQCFFVHNRVQNIEIIRRIIEKICPNVRIVVAHGQMPADQLEERMMGFIRGDFDLLLCTSIVETGLDIPNANTIIINNGQQFGLSDLHQLRGRVGRTNKKAYCYILTPHTEELPGDAEKRLRAIEQYSDLGSGMSIAMQDLDIRGAGNLLGAEQSGFITNLGFENYQRILDEAIQDLKFGEFSALFMGQDAADATQIPEVDCSIESDLNVCLPEELVPDEAERISLYGKINRLRNSHELEEFKTSLRDRYGQLPVQANALLSIPPLKWQASHMGIEKLILKRGGMQLQFISPPTSPFYASTLFGIIIGNIAGFGSRMRLEQQSSAVKLHVRQVSSVEQAQQVLTQLVTPQ